MTDNPGSRFSGASAPLTDADTSGLPREYGDTKVVILPRDPAWFYAYWEVSQAAIAHLRHRLGDEKLSASRWTLRVYDVTAIAFDGTNSHRFFDIAVSGTVDSWYVNVGEMNRSWCVDLGVRTPEGEFIMVARSNVLIMPRQGVSTVTDEHWAILQREFERLLKLSGVERIGASSFDIARLMRERWEEIVSLSLPTSPGGASSWSKNATEEARAKTFWLRADTELIVYGATEPDARLTLQGQPVKLSPDGSFSLRFFLPDGTQEYPIEAVSADGTMSKKITFVVDRKSR